jgi:hypothetical protein
VQDLLEDLALDLVERLVTSGIGRRVVDEDVELGSRRDRLLRDGRDTVLGGESPKIGMPPRSSARARAPASLRAWQRTRAPSAASALAIAGPMPREVPVKRAFLPLSLTSPILCQDV